MLLRLRPTLGCRFDEADGEGHLVRSSQVEISFGGGSIEGAVSSRAARRRLAKGVRPEDSSVVPAVAPSWERISALVCLLLLALVVGMRFVWLKGRISWYLAVDQFGYLTFAHDLLAGRLLHPWPPAPALASGLPSPTDILAQTYIWDAGRVYSRYAPGFPILAAIWIAVAGSERAHYLNPTLFCVSLVLVALVVRRVTRSWWRGITAVSLAALCPTQTHLWGVTLTRDVGTHLIALAGLYLLLPRGSPASAIAARCSPGLRWGSLLRCVPMRCCICFPHRYFCSRAGGASV